ncbi:hypothetical protein BFW38_02645 [Terasakiispira papahanaumokuakeensis]|uniref:DUF1176 domain-containing protein n=2 Tax=Terasakiispira papahanaumokuakeensis TaxID=197479 RepID=A0A1E2V6K1_9GAMM|nr:hypothetical protein BFW38_02645 [Terasakiispira papahanaumokuakeensis]
MFKRPVFKGSELKRSVLKTLRFKSLRFKSLRFKSLAHVFKTLEAAYDVLMRLHHTPVRKVVMMLILSGVAMASHAENDSVPDFMRGDWLLVCDNTLLCRAAGYPPERYVEAQRAGLILSRAAGPGTALTGRWVSTEDMAETTPLHLWMNQQDMGEVLADGRLTDSQVGQLVAMATQHVDIRLEGSGIVLPLSDHGISAVLRRMDAVQQRLNTPGALIVKGSRSEADIPTAPPKPEIQQAAVLEAQLRPISTSSAQGQQLLRALANTRAAECDLSEDYLQYAALTADKALVMKACWRAAYNAGSVAFVVDRNTFKPLQEVTFSATDYAQGTLSMMQKGRGLGDCFYLKRWVFDGEVFVVSQENSTGLCRLFPGGMVTLPRYTTRVLSP